MQEYHLPVRRTARVYTLGEPGPAVRQVWIACHGYGQLAGRFLSRFAAIARPDRLIVAPEALNRFYLDGGTGPHGPDARVGATWMTREDRLTDIDDYVHYLDRVHEHVMAGTPAGVRLVALGFSQGVATIARWAARTTARLDRLILWAGTVPPELELTTDTFRGAPLVCVLGREDPFGGEAEVEALMARLRRGGLGPRLERFEGGHRLDDDVLRRLAAELDAD